MDIEVIHAIPGLGQCPCSGAVQGHPCPGSGRCSGPGFRQCEYFPVTIQK